MSSKTSPQMISRMDDSCTYSPSPSSTDLKNSADSAVILAHHAETVLMKEDTNDETSTSNNENDDDGKVSVLVNKESINEYNACEASRNLVDHHQYGEQKNLRGCLQLIKMDETNSPNPPVKKELIKSLNLPGQKGDFSIDHQIDIYSKRRNPYDDSISLKESFTNISSDIILLHNTNPGAGVRLFSDDTGRSKNDGDEEKGINSEENNKLQVLVESCCRNWFTHKKVSLPVSFLTCLQATQDKCQDITKSILCQAKKLPNTMQNIVRCTMETSYETQFAFISLIASYLTAMYPTVPRCNCGLAFLILGFDRMEVERLECSSIYFIMVLYIISVCLDLDWLIGDYYPITLNKDNQLFVDGTNSLIIKKATEYIIALGIVLKVCTLLFYLKKTATGLQVILSFWGKIKFFLPCSLLSCSDSQNILLQSLESRVIAIIWLELVSSLVIICSSIYAHLQLSWAQQFQLKEGVLALVDLAIINLLYIKGASGILVVMAISKNCTKRAIFSEFGCVRDDDNIRVKVLINREFLVFNGFLKLLNFSIGIIAWINLLSAWGIAGSDAPKEIKVILVILMLAHILTDILATSLFAMVGCYHNIATNNSLVEKVNNSDSNLSTTAGIDKKKRNPPSSHHLRHYEEVIEKEDQHWTFNQASFALEDDIQYDQTEFSERWKLLRPGFKEVYRISKLPSSIKFSRDVFQMHRFLLIRSEKMKNNKNMVKMYLAARWCNSSTSSSVDILCEVKYDSQNMCLVIHVKFDPVVAQSMKNFRIVRDHLPLAKIFGEGIVSYYN